MSSSPLHATTESHHHSLKNDEEYAEGVNWDDLGFGLIHIDHMYAMKCLAGENFSKGQLSPFGKIEICPSSGILNYAQGRAATSLYIEDKLRRAATGGTGGVKSITNYAPVYKAQKEARAKGFSDVLFLDSVTGKTNEEITAANIFILKGNVVSSPTLSNGTVLPGVTHKSIMELALDFGYQVEERVIPLEDLLEADEAFCTGTAVTVNPIGAGGICNRKGNFVERIYERLSGIQTGRFADKMGWTLEVS